MAAAVLFHCPCSNELNLTRPPPSAAPLAGLHHHPLGELLFCEECDAIRCDTCASQEIACYFCPNCLFEVISASVRAEKNRCTRNCFQCPECDHILAVVNSDEGSASAASGTSAAGATASVGSYFLSCGVCRWDSKQVGITFEKPTGLALQLQQTEDTAPELLEFDHLKEHLEPFFRRGQAFAAARGSNKSGGGGSALSGVAPSLPSSSSTLLKDLRGLGASTRYGSYMGLSSRAKPSEGPGMLDELERYEALFPASGGGIEPQSPKERRRANLSTTAAGSARQGGQSLASTRVEDYVDRDAEMVKSIRDMTSLDDIATVDQRWTSSFKQPLLNAQLKPLRTPLHAKRTKRCPVCKHILIKPEQKPQSTRFKIKLVAAHYLPAITLKRRAPTSIGSRLSAIAAGAGSGGVRRTPGRGAAAEEDEPLRPGRTYTFELSFTNPLYEPIHVKLAVARPGANGAPKELEEGQQPPQPPFAVQLQAPQFAISAYAEPWEYDEADEADEDEDDVDDGMGTPSSSSFRKGGKRGAKGQGIVERKGNRTTVAMDVAVGRETTGTIRANMLVTYVYQDDDSTNASPIKSPTKKGAIPNKEDVKTFSFWTLVTLGNVVPRSTAESGPRRSMQLSSIA